MLGADAVLPIARILTPETLKRFLYTAWSLGMDALIEVHDRRDMEAALATPAEFIGINNRNLVSFTTSIEQTMELLPYADKSRTLISESGVFTGRMQGACTMRAATASSSERASSAPMMSPRRRA